MLKRRTSSTWTTIALSSAGLSYVRYVRACASDRLRVALAGSSTLAAATKIRVEHVLPLNILILSSVEYAILRRLRRLQSDVPKLYMRDIAFYLNYTHLFRLKSKWWAFFSLCFKQRSESHIVLFFFCVWGREGVARCCYGASTSVKSTNLPIDLVDGIPVNP